MEQWSLCDFEWDPHGLNAVPAEKHAALGPSAGQEEEGVLSSAAQTASQATAGSGEGSGGSRRVAPAVASGGGKGRRPRAGRTPATCQVEGCGVSLEGGKPFYRLQRICEQHARAMYVTDASGRALRFCQQCTRLHPVAEFEGAKRSCAVSLQRRMERKHRMQQKRQQERATADGEAAARTSRRTRGASSSKMAAATAFLAGSSGGESEAKEDLYSLSLSPSTSGEGMGRRHSNNHSGGSASTVRGQSTAAQPLPGVPAQALGHYADHHHHHPLRHQGQEQGQGQYGGLGLVPGVSQLLPMLGFDGPLQSSLAGELSYEAQLAGLHHCQQQQQQQEQHKQQQDFPPSTLVPSGSSQPGGGSSSADGWPPHGMASFGGLLGPSFPQQAQQAQHSCLTGVNGRVPASSAGPAPAGWPSQAQQAQHQTLPSLTPDEIDQLLVMEPDDLAAALLARTSAASSTHQMGPLASLSEPAGLPVYAALAANRLGVQEEQQYTTVSLSDLPSLDCFVSSPGEQMQRSLLGLSSRSAPQHAQQAKREPLDDAMFDLPPASLPAASLPLSSWPAAHETAALVQSAGAPLPQAVAAAAADPCSLEREPLVIRFSMKVYGLAPDQLPPHLRRELQSALASTPTIIIGTVRSGCTHLTLDVLLSSSEAAALQHPAGSAAVLAQLLRAWQAAQAAQQGAWRLPPTLPLLRVVAQAETASAALLLQPLEQPAEGAGTAGSYRQLASAGSVVCALAMGGPGAGSGSQEQQQRLKLAVAGPVATTVGAAGGRFVLHCPEWQQLLLGESGGGRARVLHCRSGGRHKALAVLPPNDVAQDRAGGQNWPAQVEEEQEEGGDAEVPAEGGEEAHASGSSGSGEAQSDGEAESDVGTDADDDGEEQEEEEERLRRLLEQQHGVNVWVPAAQREWGLYEFELASAAGPLLGEAAPVLVLPDGMEAEAAELLQLQAAAAAAAAGQRQLHGFTTRVLRLVNTVLCFLEQQQQQPGEVAAGDEDAGYLAAAWKRVAAAAAWLCALCVRCRWPALLRRLLPAVTASGDASSAVAAVDALLPDGLLGTAAASGSAELLTALADWAASAGHIWQLSGSGSRGLTPLHLAAALGPALSPEAAAALVAVVGLTAAAECWQYAHAGGWTPRQVATAASNVALLALLEPTAAAPQPDGEASAAPAPASPNKAGATAAAASGSSAAAAATATAAATAAAAAAEEERLRRKTAEYDEQERVTEAGEDVGLLKQHLELQLEKGAGGAAAAGVAPPVRLPATAAELEAWQQRPMHPAALALIGGAAILLVLGLAAALRSGIYA